MTGLCWCSTSVVGPLEIQLYRGFHMQAPNNFYWLQIWITKCCQNIHQNRVNPSKIDQKSLARSKSTSCNQFVFVTLQTDNNTVFGRKQPQRRPTKWLPNPLEKPSSLSWREGWRIFLLRGASFRVLALEQVFAYIQTSSNWTPQVFGKQCSFWEGLMMKYIFFLKKSGLLVVQKTIFLFTECAACTRSLSQLHYFHLRQDGWKLHIFFLVHPRNMIWSKKVWSVCLTYLQTKCITNISPLTMASHFHKYLYERK